MNTCPFTYAEIRYLVDRGAFVAFAPVRSRDGASTGLVWFVMPSSSLMRNTPRDSKGHADYGLGAVAELRKRAVLAGLIPA